MRVTAIFSYKGGVGKTTTAINLAAELAARGQRVVLIDADGQCNTTDFFEARDEYGTVYELLTGTGAAADVAYYFGATGRENLLIVPSSDELATVELRAVEQDGGRLNLTALRGFCEALAEDGETDFVIIDCPPSFAPQTVAALVAADDVIVPVTPDNWSMSGLRDLTISLNGARRANPCLRVAGVLLTKKDASAVARDTERALRESGWPVLGATIRASSHPSRCSFSRQTLREAARWSGISADYRELCDEYMEGCYHGENQ